MIPEVFPNKTGRKNKKGSRSEKSVTADEDLFALKGHLHWPE